MPRTDRPALRRALLPVLTVLACLALPGAACAVTFGIADAPGTFARCVGPGGPGTCPSNTLSGFFDVPVFRQLAAPVSRHQIRQVRLFVAYDAVEEFNGSSTDPGCTLSRVAQHSWSDGAGRTHAAALSWDDLRAGLIAARRDGLTPVVAIVGYGSPNARPGWDEPAPDPTTPQGWWETYCGVQGALNAVNKLPAADRPHTWEAFNEPDAFAVFNGNGASTDESCALRDASDVAGAARAACGYLLTRWEIQGFPDHSGDTVIAGTFTHPSVSYLRPYAALLAARESRSSFPTVWSVHDYSDVTRSYAAPTAEQLLAFDRALGDDTGGAAEQLWVTEAGTLLTSKTAFGDCPAAGVDAAGTLGACLNGDPARQALAAAAFLGLPSAGVAVPVTHLFWYEWQGTANWDSGLTDSTGAPRAAWCVLYGSGSCPGSPDVAAP